MAVFGFVRVVVRDVLGAAQHRDSVDDLRVGVLVVDAQKLVVVAVFKLTRQYFWDRTEDDTFPSALERNLSDGEALGDGLPQRLVLPLEVVGLIRVVDIALSVRVEHHAVSVAHGRVGRGERCLGLQYAVRYFLLDERAVEAVAELRYGAVE